jgi:predicted ArsR family transcriptional regulator
MADSALTDLDRAISALQDPTRRRIVFDFYAHQPEWTVEEVARAVGVHRTVAHKHLERLVALGYLTSGQRRGRSGKPAKLYRLVGQQIELSYPVRRFARLAGLLGEGLQGMGADGVRAAREVGRRYGASLVTEPVDSAGAVLEQLAPLGAEYVIVDRDQVLARNCIFRQACAVAEDVVCELHAGLLEGALRKAGLAMGTEAFRDFAERGCAYRLVNGPVPMI